jgi:hypothetical protein
MSFKFRPLTHSGSHNPSSLAKTGLGCSPFARRYLENRICFLFLRLLRCFSSARSPLTLAGGLPHSEIFVSTSVRDSTKLIAAVHVLHRLSAPRHPPYALFRFAVSLRHVLLLRAARVSTSNAFVSACFCCFNCQRSLPRFRWS